MTHQCLAMQARTTRFLIRSLDILFSLVGLMALGPLLLSIGIVVYWETGSPLFRQRRIGRHMEIFTLIKFRTMALGTPDLPSHQVNALAISSSGRLLRHLKLDELPQLWNVLVGDMSLVGPRPNLPSQIDVIEERKKLGVYEARPGITGLAQISGIDMSKPKLMARLDSEMLRGMTGWKYCYYCLVTIAGSGRRDAAVT